MVVAHTRHLRVVLIRQSWAKSGLASASEGSWVKKKAQFVQGQVSTSGFCAWDILHNLDALGNPVFCAESGRDSAQNGSSI